MFRVVPLAVYCGERAFAFVVAIIGEKEDLRCPIRVETGKNDALV